MCDDLTQQDNEEFFNGKGLTRRQFVNGVVGVGVTMCLPITANAMSVTHSYVSVSTPDGLADAYFVHPSSGQHPAVLIWPDIISFLDKQASVDTGKKMGTTGYCMGGPIVMRTAAAVPERIGAAASFHGGGLVTDGENSPHLLISEMEAQFLIAIAENDDQRDPEAKHILRKHFAEADLKAEIEVYEGAMHGWCPPDSRVYNEAQAELAWSRLLATFDEALHG